MGFEFKAIQAVPGASMITSDRRLFLAADDQTVVEEGDERSRFLLCAAGNEIPADTVKRLSLSVEDGRVVYPREPKPAGDAGAKQTDPPEDKQRAPNENKLRKRGR